LENVALEEVQVVMNLKYTNLFDNLVVVFKKNKISNKTFKMDESGISTVHRNLRNMTAENAKTLG
jgi:hypothetical protein